MSNLTKEDLITALTSLMVRHRQRTELRDGRFVPSTKEDLELYAKQYQNFLRLYTVNELEKWFMEKVIEIAKDNK
jgi:hypothetical protein